MTSSLYLEKLIAGDTQFKIKEERIREIDKRFVALFPKPVRKGWFIFGRLEFQELTRLQIKEILVRNHLVVKGMNPEVATDQALEGNYYISGQLYKFEELLDGDNNKCYKFQPRDSPD